MNEGSNAVRVRQTGLFRLENVLTQRFGAEYLASLPMGPGVYFFWDRDGQLLYIGRSAGLRGRIGSYRHVTQGRHPRRTLRLVARIHRIEWELCATAAEAIERERVLLLKRRPPFNRAGVWAGAPWWLAGEVTGNALHLRLGRDKEGLGPLPPSFRYVFGSLVRCLHRICLPGQPAHLYPRGMMNAVVPLRLALPVDHANDAWELCQECASGRLERLLARLDVLPPPASPQQGEFWLQERERLESYAEKRIGWCEALETIPPDPEPESPFALVG